MSITTQALYKSVPLDLPSCCSSWAYISNPLAWVNYGQIGESVKTTSHRPKPDVLKTNPTSLGPYVKFHYQYPVYYHYGSSYCMTGCPGYKRTGYPREAQIQCDTTPAELYWQNELAARVKDMRVNLAGDIAEYRETVDAFTDAASAVARAAKAAYQCARKVRKGDLRCLRKVLPGNKLEKLQKEYRKRHRAKLGLGDVPFVLADANLGVSFGIAPTMQTLIDSIEALQGRLGSAVYRKIKFSKVEVSDTRPRYVSTYYDLQGSALKRTIVTVDAWVRLDVNAGEFTAGNPFEAGWELVPFSWLVDYLIPVGDYLSSLDAYDGVSGIWGTATTRVTSMMSNVLVGEYESNPNRGLITPGSGEYLSYRREAFTSPPSVKWCWYEPSRSGRALANSLSVLLQLRRPRKPPPIGFFV